jgi:DNA (cytosine-5)-methyltransferase 1
MSIDIQLEDIGYKSCSEENIYNMRQSGMLLRQRTPYRVIDLFSGAGGTMAGFSSMVGHSFIPVWANDSNKDAVRTYNRNFGNHCLYGDIVTILSDSSVDIPQADVVIGGPPCQGFSLLNKQRESDPRKQLWRPFMEVVERSGASLFVMENVPQILESEEYNKIVEAATSMGFQVKSAKLCAADYGVPQVRWRAFIVGCKFADPSSEFPPKKTHVNPDQASRRLFLDNFDEYIENPSPWKTVRDAIGDLPAPIGTDIGNEPTPLNLHFGRNPTPLSLERYQAIPEEGMNRFDLQRLAPELTPACWIRKITGGTDLFGRLWWNKPSVTIRTEFFKPEKGRYLHPVQHRPITHREAARFQSFPDEFVFCGSKIEIAKQIGNAVPPLLSARVADSLFALLASRNVAMKK